MELKLNDQSAEMLTGLAEAYGKSPAQIVESLSDYFPLLLELDRLCPAEFAPKAEVYAGLLGCEDAFLCGMGYEDHVTGTQPEPDTEGILKAIYGLACLRGVTSGAVPQPASVDAAVAAAVQKLR